MPERVKIKSILPTVTSVETNTLPLEKFQNETLRQILKFQNNLILEVFEHFQHDFKINFEDLSLDKKKTKVNEILKENIQVKQFYLGLIVAFFTREEFHYYIENKKEINKRIISLLIERIVSQLVV